MVAVTPLTLAEWRDEFRRTIQQAPPVDLGGAPGVQPTAFANPTNAVINSYFNRALAKISRDAKFHERDGLINSDPAVPAAAANATGSQAVNLTRVSDGAQDINDVINVTWQPTGGPNVYLTPTSMETLDRDYPNWRQVAAGTPYTYYVYQYEIWLFPAPSVAGTIAVAGSTGVGRLVADTDVIDGLPIDYHYVAHDVAVGMFSAAQTLDIEGQDRAKFYVPLGEQGIQKIAEWYQRKNREFESSFAIRTYRQGPSTRRIRR